MLKGSFVWAREHPEEGHRVLIFSSVLTDRTSPTGRVSLMAGEFIIAVEAGLGKGPNQPWCAPRIGEQKE